MAPQNGIYTSPTGAARHVHVPGPGRVGADQERLRADAGRRPHDARGRERPEPEPRRRLRARPGREEAPELPRPDLDVPICTGTGNEALAQATYLDGVYVSSDFGKTWTKIMTAEQLRAPGTNSALQLGILGYGPGIQSWYNNWIAVDPTATDPLTHAADAVRLRARGDLGERAAGAGDGADAVEGDRPLLERVPAGRLAGVNCAGATRRSRARRRTPTSTRRCSCPTASAASRSTPATTAACTSSTSPPARTSPTTAGATGSTPA